MRMWLKWETQVDSRAGQIGLPRTPRIPGIAYAPACSGLGAHRAVDPVTVEMRLSSRAARPARGWQFVLVLGHLMP